MFEKVKSIALAISIAIVINIFFNYGIFTFYKEPEWNDFCVDRPYPLIENRQDCETAGGKWSDQAFQEVPRPAAPLEEGKGKFQGYCDYQFYCRQEFEGKHSVYNRNVFLILLVLGLATLFIGIYSKKSESVANGLLFGGILSIIIGTIRYWSNMDDYLRFIFSGIALALLIYIGYKKFKNE